MLSNTYFWSYVARFFLQGEKFSDKHCREQRNTYFMFSKFSFLENRAVLW